jgi:hypothetical protein
VDFAIGGRKGYFLIHGRPVTRRESRSNGVFLGRVFPQKLGSTGKERATLVFGTEQLFNWSYHTPAEENTFAFAADDA